MKLKKVGIWLVLLMLLSAFGLGSIATVWAADPPAQPSNFKAEALSASAIKLTWDYNSSEISGFIIERSKIDKLLPVIIDTLGPAAREYENSGLDPETWYFYWIRAYNENGESSKPEGSAKTLMAAPSTAPSNLNATTPAGSNSVSLTWSYTGSSTSIIGFIVERKTSSSDFTQIQKIPYNNVFAFSDTSVTPGLKYTYQVKAYNDGGNSPASGSKDVTIGGNPTAPTNLTVTVSSSGGVNLKWNASSNATGYRVERKSGTGSYTALTTTGAGVTAYTDANVSAGTTYTYRVGAINDAAPNTPAYSNEAVASPVGALPSAPSDLVLEVTSTSAIKLTWTDNSNNETGFEVWRRTDSGSYTLITTTKSNSAATATYSDSNLSQGRSYYYQVRAVITGGYSDYCSANTTIAAPYAPSGFNVYQATSTRYELTWRDNSDNETGFKIERSKDGGAYALLATTKANVTVYTDNTVVAGSIYDYRIKATNGVGDSAENYSSSGNQSGYMYAPSNLVLDVRSSSQIKLDWQDNSSNETGFKVERKVDNGSFTQVATAGRNATTYTDTGLSQGRVYSYRVRAYNDNEDSSYSSVATATIATPATPSTLRANWDTNARIRLVWQDRSDNETGFKIERRKDGGAFTQLTTVGPNETSYTDRDITAGVAYDYQIRAYNGVGDSDYSNVASPTGAAPADQKTIILTVGRSDFTVNGQRSTMDAPPIITESRTSLPIRYVAEAVGAEVNWDATQRKTTITMPGIVIELFVGNSIAYVNGDIKNIDPDNSKVQPFIQPPGRIMLPLRFVSENLGCKVDYNSLTREISIQYPAN